MLTAIEAHGLYKKAIEEDKQSARVKAFVHCILINIQKDASNGYCQYILTPAGYPEEIRLPIIHMLKDLGYKVKSESWFSKNYIISW